MMGGSHHKKRKKEGSQKRFLMENSITHYQLENQEQDGRMSSRGDTIQILGIRGLRRGGAFWGGGQGPEEAVAPYTDEWKFIICGYNWITF